MAELNDGIPLWVSNPHRKAINFRELRVAALSKRVSNPHRKAINLASAFLVRVPEVVFQILIGKLSTFDQNINYFTDWNVSNPHRKAINLIIWGGHTRMRLVSNPHRKAINERRCGRPLLFGFVSNPHRKAINQLLGHDGLVAREVSNPHRKAINPLDGAISMPSQAGFKSS